ncbi:MAG: anthrone oxygenase family protein [Pseudomonadota bacterium]
MLQLVLVGAGLIASILAAGLFYAFSGPVMRGLAGVEAGIAVAAMRAINERITTPVFAFVFFGPALLPALGALTDWHSAAALPALAASLVYAGGTIAVTFRIHLPLNAALASGTGDAGATWAGFAPRWTLWNHVRTAASLLACLLLVAALARP